jgi:hypothetical protein
MSKKVVETVYSKHHKYEIVRDSGVLSTKYYVRKEDGSTAAGSFNSLKAAVEWAEEKS